MFKKEKLMKKEKHPNQYGELTSDKPGDELIKPSKKGNKYISTNTEGTRNSTGKDPKLGSSHVTR